MAPCPPLPADQRSPEERRLELTDIVARDFAAPFVTEPPTDFLRAVCEAAFAHVVTDKTEAAYRSIHFVYKYCAFQAS